MSRVVKRTNLKNGYTLVESYRVGDYLIISLIFGFFKLIFKVYKLLYFSLPYYVLKIIFFLIRNILGVFLNKETKFWKVINDKKYTINQLNNINILN